jgi:hypothetical protein
MLRHNSLTGGAFYFKPNLELLKFEFLGQGVPLRGDRYAENYDAARMAGSYS